jgi:hypothetical protein
MAPRPTIEDWGDEHAEDARNDPDRDVGNPQKVINNGNPFHDNSSGYEVYVDGNKVVVMDGNRFVTQWADQTARQTNWKIANGIWTPLNK